MGVNCIHNSAVDHHCPVLDKVREEYKEAELRQTLEDR